MDDLELRLKSLSVGAPSENLRKRIFGEKPKRHEWKRYGPRRPLNLRIPLAWAALMMMAIGVAGFAAGRLGEKSRRPIAYSRESVVRIQLIEAPAGRQIFDFTQTSAGFLSGKPSVRTESESGA